MKKTLLSLGLTMAAIFTLTNCTKEITTPEAAGDTFEFVANTPDTKTGQNGLTTVWTTDDALNVMYGAAGSTADFINCGQFTVSDPENGTFTGTLSNSPKSGSSYNWYALYPYTSQFTSPANTKCYITVGSSVQTQNGNNNMAHLAGSNVPMYGYSAAQTFNGTAPTVSMNHLCTLFKVHVTNGSSSNINVSSITVSNSSEQISGTFYVSFVGGNVTYTSSGEDKYTKKYAMLQVNKGEAIVPGASSDFYIAACPFTLAQGSKMTVTIASADDKTCTKKYTATSELTFKAGMMKTLNVTYVPDAAITYSTVKEVLADCASLASNSTSEDSYNVKDAVVMAKSGTNNFILSDGTANILYYGASATTAVGDVVKVTGKIKNYYGTLEFASDQTIETTGTTTPSYPTATTADEAYITSYASNIKCDYVTVTGTVDNSGYIVVGAKKVRVYNISDTDFSSFKGKYVDATGYVYGYHSSGYAQFIASSMVESQNDYLTLDPASLSWAAAETSAKTVTVSCNSTWSVDASTVPAWITVGTEGSTITLTPSANTGDAREATITVKHSNGTNTATIAVSQTAAPTGNTYKLDSDAIKAAHSEAWSYTSGTKAVTAADGSSWALYNTYATKNQVTIQMNKGKGCYILTPAVNGKITGLTVEVNSTAAGTGTASITRTFDVTDASGNAVLTNIKGDDLKAGQKITGSYSQLKIAPNETNGGSCYIKSITITFE